MQSPKYADINYSYSIFIPEVDDITKPPLVAMTTVFVSNAATLVAHRSSLICDKRQLLFSGSGRFASRADAACDICSQKRDVK